MRTASLFSRLDAVKALNRSLPDSCRSTSRATRRLTFEDGSQTCISSLDKRSVEDAQISLQVSSLDAASASAPSAPPRLTSEGPVLAGAAVRGLPEHRRA